MLLVETIVALGIRKVLARITQIAPNKWRAN